MTNGHTSLSVGGGNGPRKRPHRISFWCRIGETVSKLPEYTALTTRTLSVAEPERTPLISVLKPLCIFLCNYTGTRMGFRFGGYGGRARSYQTLRAFRGTPLANPNSTSRKFGGKQLATYYQRVLPLHWYGPLTTAPNSSDLPRDWSTI